MKPEMTSRERMLCTMDYKEVDYTPCSFMLFYNLTNKVMDPKEIAEAELKMGLDATVNVGNLRNSFHPDTKYSEWTDKIDGVNYFNRKLETPKGPLTQRIVQINDWPNEKFFPMFDDYIVPRAKEVFLKPEKDLDKLQYLLGPASKENIDNLRESAKEAKKIADKYSILQVAGELSRNIFTSGYYSLIMGADAISWLSGFVDVMILSLTKPEIIKEYVDFISEWNMKQIEIYLDITDVDLIARRAWYETTEFWTPDAYRDIIAPTIKREADLVHRAGKKYGYMITSAFLPIIDHILDTGIDVLIGFDPVEGKGTSMDVVKEKFLNKKKTIWGGVSGAVTLENGTLKETEKAAMDAIKVLGKQGGFILSPVDNVREETSVVWANTNKFIDTWKKYRDLQF
jgi:hypothetical protein